MGTLSGTLSFFLIPVFHLPSNRHIPRYRYYVEGLNNKRVKERI